MSMEFFKSKADLINEIKDTEMKVRLARHLLELKEKDYIDLVSTNADLKKKVEELEKELKKLKFNNIQQTFTWR